MKHGRQSIEKNQVDLFRVSMKSVVVLALRDEVPLAGASAVPSVVVRRSRPQQSDKKATYTDTHTCLLSCCQEQRKIPC